MKTLHALVLVGSLSADAFVQPQQAQQHQTVGDRRAFLSNLAILGGGSFLMTQPANAIGGGVKKANAKLASYGLPQIKDLPGGFTPLVDIYGKGKNRTPILVEFVHPLDWVVSLPSQDINGEDGTIQAGDYGKGDSAVFYNYQDLGRIKDVERQSKDVFEKAIIKAISQKGDNVYQNFKLTKVNLVKGEYDDQVYAICDFKYTLLTGAGFEVDRIGVASVTSVGESIQVFWTASTRQRYKKTEDTLRIIANSFRCYADGLNLSASLSERNDSDFL